MGTKNNPAPYDCYANALPDEPMFVLLARDLSAPDVVRLWAHLLDLAIKAGHKPETDTPKVGEARGCAENMIRWRREHYGEWRDPQPATPPDPRLAFADAAEVLLRRLIRQRPYGAESPLVAEARALLATLAKEP